MSPNDPVIGKLKRFKENIFPKGITTIFILFTNKRVFRESERKIEDEIRKKIYPKT